jgi:hypothetical protein
MEQIELVAGVLNVMASQVTDPDAPIDTELVKKHVAQINPDLVSDERAKRVRKAREGKDQG